VGIQLPFRNLFENDEKSRNILFGTPKSFQAKLDFHFRELTYQKTELFFSL